MNYKDNNSSRKTKNFLNIFNQSPAEKFLNRNIRMSRSRSRDRLKMGFSPLNGFDYQDQNSRKKIGFNQIENFGFSFERKLDRSSSSKRNLNQRDSYNHSIKGCGCGVGKNVCCHHKVDNKSSDSFRKMKFSNQKMPQFLHPQASFKSKITDFGGEYDIPKLELFEKNVFSSPLSHQKVKNVHNYDQSTNICVEKKKEGRNKIYQ